MSYSLKGFIQLSGSLVNTPSVIAPFGELSKKSQTYSREQKVYVDADPAKIILTAFHTKNSSGSVEIPEVIKTKIFEIVNWIIQIQNSNNAFNTRTSFLSALTAQFNLSLGSINCGEMVNNGNGIYFPSWIGFVQLNISNSQFYSENQVKLWFADAAFQNEYDENELIIVPPVPADNMNALFNSKASVEILLNNFRNNSLIQAISAATGSNPSTDILSESYLWKDPSNALNTLNTNWTVIVYGRLDGNSDYIKDAIRAYIATKSNRPEVDWKAILPDVYLSTEFYVFPRWKNMAISEMTLNAGQYSPIINLKKETGYIKSFLGAVPTQHIENYLTSIPFQYRSILALFISGADNRDNIFSIQTLFPDYLNVPTSDILFDQQAVKTREWVLLMTNVLIQAEKTGDFDSVPSNMRKVTRSGILYISVKHDNVEYLVATKAGTPAYP